MEDEPRHHRPALPGAGLFESQAGDIDPSAHREAADRVATLLVRGAHGTEDEQVVARVITLADTEGLEALADLWASAPANSLAGSLWRLYLLRAWVYADPQGAAREFDLGRRHAPVQEAIAGVSEPPGVDEVRHLVDAVLRGVVQGDFADTLFRASAFARVAAVGRSGLAADHSSDLSASRLLGMADQLEQAGRLELAGDLS